MNYANLPQNKDIANKVLDHQAASEAAKLERGAIGKIFGGRESVPYNVAAVISVGTFLAIVSVIWISDENTSWPRKDIAAYLLSLLTLTLGYLLGRGKKS